MTRAARLLVGIGSGWLVWGGQARAQGLDAQSFDPTIDGHAFSRVDDSILGAEGAGGGLMFNYASQPLVFRFDDPDDNYGQEEVVLLSSVATFDLLGFYNVDRYRIGIDVPLNPLAEGYEVADGYLLGDIALDAKVEVWDRLSRPMGLAFAGRFTAPTGNENAFLGAPRATFSGRAIASTGHEVVTALNLGLSSGRTTVEDGFTLGSQLLVGAGMKLPLADQTWISTELSGRYYFNASPVVEGFATEALASLHVSPVSDLVVTMGSGVGTSQGVGAPDFRLVMGMMWSPQRATLAVATGPDLDGDGIPDAQDRCPDQPEDYNGVDDFDGCPDGEWTPTTLYVVGPKGGLVAGAQIELLSGPVSGAWVTEAGELTRALLPGDYLAAVEAEGFHGSEVRFTVPAGVSFEQRLHLEGRGSRDGRMVVHVSDIDGVPIAGATIRVLGEDSLGALASADGVIEQAFSPGAREVVISAPGYKTVRRMVNLREDSEALVDIVLKPARVEVTSDRVLIHERVYFEYDSAVIRADSHPLLNEVITILLENPGIELIEIQGHTDDRGSEVYNLELSQRRAEAVRNYLIRGGVSSARLVARGYGEGIPIAAGDHDTNRRVEFHILRRR